MILKLAKVQTPCCAELCLYKLAHMQYCGSSVLNPSAFQCLLRSQYVSANKAKVLRLQHCTAPILGSLWLALQ